MIWHDRTIRLFNMWPESAKEPWEDIYCTVWGLFFLFWTCFVYRYGIIKKRLITPRAIVSRISKHSMVLAISWYYMHGITFDIKLCFTWGKKNLYLNVVKFQNIMARFAVKLLHYFVSSNLLLPALFVLNQVDPIPPLRNYTCKFCLFCDINGFSNFPLWTYVKIICQHY